MNVMNQPVIKFFKSAQCRKAYFGNTTLILVAFSTCFFARIFCSITHLPSALIHFHFFTILLACAIAIFTTQTTDTRQRWVSWMLLYGLFLLLTVMVASALLNNAGIINFVFHFLMLGEPFILLLAIICLPMTSRSIERFRQWIIVSSFINLILALIQWQLLKIGKISAGGLDATDGMAGVFFVSGAGNYVSTTVSIYFSLYYFLYIKTAPLWLRYLALAAAFLQLQLSDAKQVLIALLAAWAALVLFTMKDLQKALSYAALFALVGLVFYWCIYHVAAFSAFKNYLDRDGIYGPNGVATLVKTAAFRIIPTYYQSDWNWLFGLGSGHTVSRLGGWLLRENWNIFGSLGATTHPASSAVLQAYYSSWIALESTMFSPMFGWAGIWGDLGLLGLGTYLLLWIIVWRYLCPTYFSKFLLLSVFMFGFIFTQMEEPGYMQFTVVLIGLRWHEERARLKNTKISSQLEV